MQYLHTVLAFGSSHLLPSHLRFFLDNVIRRGFRRTTQVVAVISQRNPVRYVPSVRVNLWDEGGKNKKARNVYLKILGVLTQVAVCLLATKGQFCVPGS